MQRSGARLQGTAVYVLMAIVAAVLYAYWAMAENKSARWFIGPALIGVFFAVLLVLDIPNLPRL